MRNDRKKGSVPPGADYLYAIDDLPRSGEKCKCTDEFGDSTSGKWLVEFNGRLFTITPNNQLQKDMWLGAAKRKIGEVNAIALLRWLCDGCGKVQMP